MIKKRVKLHILLCFVLLLSSCTEEKHLTAQDGFQKRKYLKGHYHVAKNFSSMTIVLEEIVLEEKSTLATTSSIGQDPKLEIIDPIMPRKYAVPFKSNSTTTKPGHKTQKRSLISNLKEAKGKIASNKTDGTKSRTPDDRTRVNRVGLLGFISGILSIALLVLISPFGILLAIPALILGLVGLGDFKQEPGKYKGRGFALTGMIIGATILFLVILLLLLFASSLQ